MDQTRTADVTMLIREQHQQVRQLMAEVETATPAHRAAKFAPLVRLLAVHETAEEEVVYPDVRGVDDRAEAIVAARVAEEDAAKKSLARLEAMDPASDEFAQAFAAFGRDVLRHAESEELEVLPLLARHDADRLRTMGKAFAAAEKIAPTHAHGGAPESALGNAIVGPFVAIADRVRDAIRKRTD